MLLSICIPTFNRCGPLLELLHSIEVSLSTLPDGEEIEVIVSDNASTDGTEKAILSVMARMPYVSYVRSTENRGFAYNLNRSVSLASGQYCWLLGSDDRIVPASLRHIIDRLSDEPTILIGTPITNKQPRNFFKFRDEKDIKIVNASDFESYVSQCNEISALFAFISTIIIRRQFWSSVKCTEYEIEHPYTHMLRITKGVLTYRGTIRCLNYPVVYTGHEGNEWNVSVLPHLELDLLTIKYLVSNILPPCPGLKKNYADIFRRQYGSLALLKARVECEATRWAKLAPILLEFGYAPEALRKFKTDKILYIMYMAVKYVRQKI